MTVVEPVNDDADALDVDAAFGSWLAEFARAVETADPELLAQQFEEDGHWRDILALTWRYQTFSGIDAIKSALADELLALHPRNARAASGRTPPRLVKRSARRLVEAYFDFDTDQG